MVERKFLLLVCTLMVNSLFVDGQVYVFKSIGLWNIDCPLSIYNDHLDLIRDTSQYTARVHLPSFVTEGVIRLGGDGLIRVLDLNKGEHRTGVGDELVYGFNLGSEGYFVYGSGYSPRPELRDWSKLYLVDDNYVVMHSWEAAAFRDSLTSGRRRNTLGSHMYLSTDTSVILSYGPDAYEYLTKPPFTKRQLDEPIFMNDTWFSAPENYVSNYAYVHPACDSTYYVRLVYNALTEESYACIVNPVTYQIDTLDIEIDCIQSANTGVGRADALSIISTDMRYRRPPPCVLDISLDGDGSTQSPHDGDYYSLSQCLSDTMLLLDADAVLESNGGRIAYINIRPQDPCLLLDTSLDSSYRWTKMEDDVRLYLDDQTDYAAALEALRSVRVSWCTSVSDGRYAIDVEVVLTTGPSITVQAIYRLEQQGKPPIEFGDYLCVEGSLDTILVVESPGRIVQASTTIYNEVFLVHDCTDEEISYIVEDADGCRYLRTLEIDAYTPAVANAFSPNGDQINDTFNPCGSDDCNYQIYDRWGNRVAKGDGDVDWQGLSGTKGVTQGLYTWVSHNSNGLTRHGTVLLLR